MHEYGVKAILRLRLKGDTFPLVKVASYFERHPSTVGQSFVSVDLQHDFCHIVAAISGERHMPQELIGINVCWKQHN